MKKLFLFCILGLLLSACVENKGRIVYIGQWSLDLGNVGIDDITLIYDTLQNKFFIADKMPNYTDTSEVIVQKQGKGYRLDYKKEWDDRYRINEEGILTMISKGHISESASPNYFYEDQLETYYVEPTETELDLKEWKDVTKEIDNSELEKLMEWSKGIIEKTIVNSKSIVYPNYNQMVVFKKGDDYKVKYSITAKDLYNSNKQLNPIIKFKYDEKKEFVFSNLDI
jgi:hypothetical protein